MGPSPDTPRRAMDLLRSTAGILRQSAIEDPEKEAEILITWATGLDRVALYRDEPPIEADKARDILAMAERRARREPLQYIMGSVEFRGLTIHVGPGVLIPRPETELIIEALEKYVPVDRTHGILDLCTGSGCLALAAAVALPGSKVTGIDISEEALSFARRNAGENGIENVRFLQGHLYEPVKNLSFDVILSNPPYVAHSELDTLQPEILDWEPRQALDGGPNGLDFYREILKDAPGHLVPEGLVILELGWGQAKDVAKTARSTGLEVVEVINDLCGIERVMVLRNIRSQR